MGNNPNNMNNQKGQPFQQQQKSGQQQKPGQQQQQQRPGQANQGPLKQGERSTTGKPEWKQYDKNDKKDK